MLEGYRGSQPLSIDALAECASALSQLAWDLRDCLEEIEINPVFVTADKAIAADAVLNAKQSEDRGAQEATGDQVQM